MCKKSSSTTSNNLPPGYIQAAQQKAIAQAEALSQRPLQQYAGPTVAGFTPAQMNAFNTVNAAQGMTNPYINAGAQYTTQAANSIANQTPFISNPATAGLADTAYNTYTNPTQQTQKFFDPYMNTAIQGSLDWMNNQDQQQQNQLVGNAVSAGAWGGDRAGVAQAVLGGQQALAKDQMISQMENQGYTQAQQAALQYGSAAQQAYATQLQAQQQAASQQGLLDLYAGSQMGQLGSEAQNNTLAGANAQLGIGAQQQGLTQQQLNQNMQQFQTAQQYPYQQLQFLDSIINGTAGLAGGSTRTQQPAGSLLSQLAGAGLLLGGTGAFSGSNGSPGWLSQGFDWIANQFQADGGAIGEYDGGGAIPVSSDMSPIQYLMLRNKMDLFQNPFFDTNSGNNVHPPAYGMGGADQAARQAARDARIAARGQKHPGDGGHQPPPIGGGGGGNNPPPPPSPVPGTPPPPVDTTPPGFNGVSLGNILRAPTPQPNVPTPMLPIVQPPSSPLSVNPTSNFTPLNPNTAPTYSTPSGLLDPSTIPVTIQHNARGGHIDGYPLGGGVGTGFGSSASPMTGSNGGWSPGQFANAGIGWGGQFLPSGWGFGLGVGKGIYDNLAYQNIGGVGDVNQPNNNKSGLFSLNGTPLGERAYWYFRNMLNGQKDPSVPPGAQQRVSGPTNTAVGPGGPGTANMTMNPSNLDVFGGASGDIAGNMSGTGFFGSMFGGNPSTQMQMGDMQPASDFGDQSQNNKVPGKAGGGNVMGGYSHYGHFRGYDDGGGIDDDEDIPGLGQDPSFTMGALSPVQIDAPESAGPSGNFNANDPNLGLSLPDYTPPPVARPHGRSMNAGSAGSANDLLAPSPDQAPAMGEDTTGPTEPVSEHDLPPLDSGHGEVAPGPSSFDSWMQNLATNPRLAMIAAGLGMMGSKGNFGQAIAEGGMNAIKVLQQQHQTAFNENYANESVGLKAAQLNAQLEALANRPGPWRAVTDPDTGEISFYNTQDPSAQPGGGGGAPNNMGATNMPGAIPGLQWAGNISGKMEDPSGAPGAKNPRSSATGPGQFIDSTWLKTFRETHPDMASMPDAQILGLRSKTPQQLQAMGLPGNLSLQMTAAYGRDNAAALQAAGEPVNSASLALAHRLGPGDAQRVLAAGANTPLSSLLSKDVISRNPDLKNMTAGQLAQNMVNRFGTAPVDFGGGGGGPGGGTAASLMSGQGGQGVPGLPSMVNPKRLGNPVELNYTDPNTKEEVRVLGQQDRRTGQWYTADGNRTPIPSNNISLAPSGAASGRMGGQAMRVMTSAADVTTDLHNLTSLPAGTTTGTLFGRHQGPGLMDAVKENLANAITSEDAQAAQTFMIGLGRGLATLETGGVYMNQGLSDQISRLAPVAGDKYNTILRKYAAMRQQADNALNSAIDSPIMSPEQKNRARQLKQQLARSIPYTPDDVLMLERIQETHPDASLRNIGAGVSRADLEYTAHQHHMTLDQAKAALGIKYYAY